MPIRKQKTPRNSTWQLSKRLKRGDDNELERNLRLALETEEERRARLENDAATKRLRLAIGDGRRKKSKTGEDGSYRTAHVSPD